ncbi:hypothetical protein SRB17_37360 [Streptomyces sp. RB17]|uniref:hypothetical protein n=1 Tax=Streptomyces sp. RB17 TaxID=2585197 RepID=UPI001307FBAC|nr:hypothetical protein [Streptomyces sp. RB17]MQY35744.1 hypothetical protein [Streptomyces sp. RB17]
MLWPALSRERDPRKLRLLALAVAVTAAVVLPLAVASAGPVGEAARHAMAGKPRDAVRSPGPSGASGSRGAAGSEAAAGSTDAKLPSLDGPTRLLGLGLATAARCGPQLTSPDGIEAQTCVLAQGADTWARTYYRNSTGKPLDSVLSLMGPGGHSLEMRCVTGADDEPATCETPREHSRGGMDAYTAVTEFAAHGSDGALLLRSGSNSMGADGNSGSIDGS